MRFQVDRKLYPIERVSKHAAEALLENEQLLAARAGLYMPLDLEHAHGIALAIDVCADAPFDELTLHLAPARARPYSSSETGACASSLAPAETSALSSGATMPRSIA